MNNPSINHIATVLSAVVCLLVSHESKAATAVDVTNPGFFGTVYNIVGGWEFSTLQPIEITAWGLWDHNRDGIVGPNASPPDGFDREHTLSLWTPTGNLLTSVVMPSGTQAPLTGRFRFVSSSTYLLNPGTYIISSAPNGDPGDDLVPSAVQSASFHPAITYLGGRYADGASTFPNVTLGGPLDPPRYFGPNFQFAVVPEPSTVSLIVLGLAIGGYCRLRGRA